MKNSRENLAGVREPPSACKRWIKRMQGEEAHSGAEKDDAVAGGRAAVQGGGEQAAGAATGSKGTGW